MAKLKTNKRHPRNFCVKGEKLCAKYDFSNREMREAVKNGHWFINPPRSEAKQMMSREQFNEMYYTPARISKKRRVVEEMKENEELAFAGYF